MSYIISYEDKKQQSTVFLKKKPNPDTPRTLEWNQNLSGAHQFDDIEEVTGVLETSLADYEGVYVLNVPMGRET